MKEGRQAAERNKQKLLANVFISIDKYIKEPKD